MNLIERLVDRHFFGALRVPWRWPSGAEREEDWEPVRFDGPEGAVLAGLYGRPAGAARGTVVCAHPLHPAAKGFFLHYGHARLLREAGYNVLLFDLNGFGQSARWGYGFARDILAAGWEAKRRAPDVPVGLLGVCSGAAWGLCACAREAHPFAAAVLEGPFTTFEAYFLASGRAGSRGAVQRWRRQHVPRLLLRTYRAFSSRRGPDLRPVERIGDACGRTPLLLVYGQADPITPVSMGRGFMDAWRTGTCRAGHFPEATCALWEVPEGKHLRALGADPVAYRRRVTDFFDRAFNIAQPAALKFSVPV